MRIVKVTIEFEVADGHQGVKELRDMLDAYMEHAGDDPEEPVGEIRAVESTAGDVDMDHLIRLRRLEDGLSDKQRQIWTFMLENPGPVTASVLKERFEWLRPQGALAGVFRATRRWMALGGLRETSPFVQVRWLGAEGGEYRGLTAAEVTALAQFRQA